MPKVEMAVYKDEAEPAERSEGEHAPNENAAVATQDQREVPVTEHCANLAGEIHRELPNGLPAYYRSLQVCIR